MDAVVGDACSFGSEGVRWACGLSSRCWTVPIVDDNGVCNKVVFANVMSVYGFDWGIIELSFGLAFVHPLPI